MSKQQNWANYGFGFVMAHSYGDKEREYETLAKAMGYDNINAVLESKERDDHEWRFCSENDETEGKTFTSFNGKYEEPDEMLVIWAKKWSGIRPFKAVYSDMNELKEEFRSLLGEYLPEDFDWDSHIGEFSFSNFC